MNRGRHRVPLEGWRKSSQWMGLIREHAELFVNDKVINEIFEAYCSPSNACYSGVCPSLAGGIHLAQDCQEEPHRPPLHKR